jgi:hypothetical protein
MVASVDESKDVVKGRSATLVIRTGLRGFATYPADVVVALIDVEPKHFLDAPGAALGGLSGLTVGTSFVPIALRPFSGLL